MAILVILGALFVARQDERAAQQRKQKTADVNSPVVPAVTDAEHSHQDTEQITGDSPSWLGFLRWPNGTTTLAILLTLMAIAEQTEATSRATRAAENSIVLTHRPKIIVRSVVIPWLAILNRRTPMNAGENLDDSQLGGFFYAVNVGNQDAILESLDEFMFFNENLPMERPYESGQNRRHLGVTIQPGNSCKILFTPKQTHSLELAVVAVNESPFVAGGRIIYSDRLGNRRETAFCRRVDHSISRLVAVTDPDYEYSD